MGGSEESARGLTAALAEYGSRRYLVATPPDGLDAASGLLAVAAGALGSSGRMKQFMRAAAATSALDDADVVHYPLTVPLPFPRRPHVVTLHDVLHLDLPELVPRHVRLFRAFAYDGAARRADRVVVPSVFVLERAVARLGIDATIMRVIGHAVDPLVFHPGVEEREPFLLYPARSWPHKNHELLLDAFTTVRRVRPELQLVLTGGAHSVGSSYEGVRSLGFVTRLQLADLYRRAAALVFPSRYEGFGQPVLEAMASGCPVVATAGGALEEVAAGAAVLWRGGSPGTLAEAISEGLDRREELVARGIDVAGRHTRERVARLHDDVYAELD